MACACRKGTNPFEYVWTDGTTEVVYEKEILAKARVSRRGGTYQARRKAGK